MNNETTIRGDLLLLALQYIERSCASFFADPLGDDLQPRVWNALKADIVHAYGDAHWYAQIAIRAHARTTLEYAMDIKTRVEAHFFINDVAESAVAVTSGSDIVNGLSDDDKRKLTESLTRFLSRVACGEICEDILRNP